MRDGPLGFKVRDRLSALQKTDPSWLRRATLWVSESTQIPPTVDRLRTDFGLSVRLLPELLPSDNIGRCSVRRGACNGHIGKAYALLHATDFRQETASIVFDGDTQLCNGWLEQAILPWLSTCNHICNHICNHAGDPSLVEHGQTADVGRRGDAVPHLHAGHRPPVLPTGP